MSLQECTGAGCVAKPEAIAEADGRPISVALLPNWKKELAAGGADAGSVAVPARGAGRDP